LAAGSESTEKSISFTEAFPTDTRPSDQMDTSGDDNDANNTANDDTLPAASNNNTTKPALSTDAGTNNDNATSTADTANFSSEPDPKTSC